MRSGSGGTGADGTGAEVRVASPSIRGSYDGHPPARVVEHEALRRQEDAAEGAVGVRVGESTGCAGDKQRWQVGLALPRDLDPGDRPDHRIDRSRRTLDRHRLDGASVEESETLH